MLVALVILAIGVLAIAKVFPVGSRQQVRDKLLKAAAFYAQEKLEQLVPMRRNDANLTEGRHPAGIAVETLGNSGQWRRYYDVATMAAPLENLKKITVSVYWTSQRGDTVSVVTYKRP